MEFFVEDEIDNDSRYSLTNEDSNESDFDFDYDELVDGLDELQVSDEYSHEIEVEVDSISESYIGGGSFTFISPKDVTLLSVFKNFLRKKF